MVKKRRPFFGVTIIALLMLLDLGFLLRMMEPRIQSAMMTFEDKNPVAVTMPLQELMDEGNLRIDMTVTAAALHATTYRIIPDNCIRALTVNAQKLPLPTIAACDYDRGFTIDLSPALHKGENHIIADLWNGGGYAGMTMRVANADPLVLTILLAMCATIIAYAAFLGRRLWPKNTTRVWLISLYIAGVMIRLLYVGATPHSVRGHDYDGHLGYIEYIAEEAKLPRTDFNKQTYHPPLYHLLGAAVWATGESVGLSSLSLPKALQTLSLVLSGLTLGVGMAAGSLVLSGWTLVLFAAGLAAFPALVLVAPQINNDALFQLWTILAVALLLRWWKRETLGRWVAFAIIITLAMLTKSNALAVAVAGGACLLMRPHISWKRKIGLSAVLCASLLVSTAAITLLSRQADVEDGFVGNASTLTNFVPNRPRNLLTFNPVAMMLTPYNNPFEVANRKDYALEFYFRSVLFGEYQFGSSLVWLARVMLGLALLLLPPLLAQCIGDLLNRHSKTYPLAVIMIVGLAAMAAFRILLPVSSAQDFRYTLFLAVPVCIYLASPKTLPRRLRTPTQIILALLALCSTIFYVAFSFSV